MAAVYGEHVMGPELDDYEIAGLISDAVDTAMDTWYYPQVNNVYVSHVFSHSPESGRNPAVRVMLSNGQCVKLLILPDREHLG